MIECIKNWLLKESDNLSNLIGYTLVFIGLALTYWQWRKDQNWKKKEILINRINAFNETPGAHNAILMLDWPDRDIPLWAKEKIEDRFERIKRKEVALALIPNYFLPLVYSPKESAIRDCFEDYLIKLSHLEVFLETKLLSDKDAQVIMQDLLNSLETLKTGNEDDRALLRHFYVYIEWKKYFRLKKLFKRFKISLAEEVSDANAILKDEISSGKWTRIQSF